MKLQSVFLLAGIAGTLLFSSCMGCDDAKEAYCKARRSGNGVVTATTDLSTNCSPTVSADYIIEIDNKVSAAESSGGTSTSISCP